MTPDKPAKSPRVQGRTNQVATDTEDAVAPDTARHGAAPGAVRALPSRGSLRFVIVTGLILLQIVTVAGILLSQHLNEQQVLRGHMKQTMVGVIDEIKKNAQDFLTSAQNVAELSRRLYEAGMISWVRRTDLERYFIEQLRIIPQLDAVYFGDRRGQFLMVRREHNADERAYLIKTIRFDAGVRRVEKRWLDRMLEVVESVDEIDDAYDPRTRPWYKNALAKKELVWTDPYVFFTSKQPGITTAVPVFSRQNGVQGVLGVDLEIGTLSNFLGEQKVGQRGAALIINRQGDYIAHSHAERVNRDTQTGQLRLVRIDELVDPIEKSAITVFRTPGELLNFAWLNQEDTLHATFDVYGETYHAIFRPFPKTSPWPWVIGVYVAETDFIGPIRRGERNEMVVAIVISAGITLVAFLLARRFMRPVVALRDEVDRDVLTGVRNRRGLFEIAPRMVEQARKNKWPLSVIIVDIDQFKKINDTHGHAVGDQVLTAVASRLRGAVELEDLLARYAGDEFILLLPQTGIAVASQVGERLCATISGAPIMTTSGEIVVTVSLGVADLGTERHNFEMIFDEADRALRFAKVNGRNRVAVASMLPTSADAGVAAR